MKTLSRAAALLTTIMTLLSHNAFAGPLDDYQYKNRLIVLSLPQDSDVEAVQTMLAAHREGIEERHLRIIDVSPSEQKIPTAMRLNPSQNEAVRHQLKLDVQQDIPTFVLIGKDGGEAARSHGTWDLEKWFTLIDTMPMRQAEMLQQKKQSLP